MKKKNKWIFIGFLLILGSIKQFFLYDLPIMAVPTATADDGLMLKLAESLRNGQWLGAYNDFTLTKGMFFPLYIAVGNFFQLSYLNMTALFYTGSCIVFIYALKPLLKKYWIMGSVYVLLLWNPISYGLQTFQRVYRNSISYSQALLIFGGFFALYLRRKEDLKKQWFWIVVASFGWASFVFTREDYIWVVPFLLVFIFVYTGMIIGEFLKEKKKIVLIKIGMILIPFFFTFMVGQGISLLNQHYYGIYTTNELNDSGFTKMYKTMMSVKPEEDIWGVTITQEKIARMCEVSPTLKEIEPYFETARELWAGESGDATDWEVQDGWVFWIIRSAFKEAGYYENGEVANEVYLQVHEELEAALEAGLLERQATMPSTYMSPWREEYFFDLFGALGEAIVYTTTYQDVETLVYLYSEPDEMGGIPLFEEMTGDKTVWEESDMITFAGWYAFYEGMEDISLQVEGEDGIVYETIEWLESEDIKTYLASQGIESTGLEQCRFYVKFYTENKDQKYFLCVYKGEEKIENYELGEEQLDWESETSKLTLDWYWDVPERHGYLADIFYKGEFLNGITEIYSKTGAVIALASILSYVGLCITLLQKKRKKEKDAITFDIWLLLSALLASYFVLLGGISYSAISGWNAILYWYLSGGYPIMAAFEIGAIIWGISHIYRKMRKKHD